MAGTKSRVQKKLKTKHRAVKPRYTQADWERLAKTGMAWELFPGGPETFVGKIVDRARFDSTGGAPVPLEPKKDNHAARHEAKKREAQLEQARLDAAAKAAAEAAELAALEAAEAEVQA